MHDAGTEVGQNPLMRLQTCLHRCTAAPLAAAGNRSQGKLQVSYLPYGEKSGGMVSGAELPAADLQSLVDKRYAEITVLVSKFVV